MPPLEDERVIFDTLLEIGLSSDGGLEAIPLTWAELAAYSSLVRALEPWEASLLRDLSQAYLSGRKEYEAPLARAPWHEGWAPMMGGAIHD